VKRKPAPREHLTTGRTRRALKVGSLTTQVGGSYLLSALTYYQVTARTCLSAALLAQGRSQEARAEAEHGVRLLEQLGGTGAESVSVWLALMLVSALALIVEPPVPTALAMSVRPACVSNVS